jgi:hypothetical protein
MSYSTIYSNDQVSVLEKNTQLIMFSGNNTKEEKEKAKKLCRTLNLGAAFAGWTPEFFTLQYK